MALVCVPVTLGVTLLYIVSGSKTGHISILGLYHNLALDMAKSQERTLAKVEKYALKGNLEILLHCRY